MIKLLNDVFGKVLINGASILDSEFQITGTIKKGRLDFLCHYKLNVESHYKWFLCGNYLGLFINVTGGDIDGAIVHIFHSDGSITIDKDVTDYPDSYSDILDELSNILKTITFLD